MQTILPEILKIQQAFVHMSTAYSNCNRKTVDEVIYPTVSNPEKVFEVVKVGEAEGQSHMSQK